MYKIKICVEILKGDSFMKKIISISLIIVLSIVVLSGCNIFNEKSSTSENSKERIDNVPTKNKNDDNNKIDKSIDNKEKNIDNSINNKSNIKNNNKQSLDELMIKIKKYVIEEKVINSNFKLRDYII